jgi:hypothetical protein
MATATMNGRVCEVRTQRDLEKNWAVGVLSGEQDTVSLVARDRVPVLVKVHARSRWHAEEAVLRSLKDRGVITDYVLDAKPEEPAGGEGDDDAE